MNQTHHSIGDRASKIVLITGCSTGIGRASAHVLRQAGFDVYTTARKPTDIDRLRRQGFPCHFLDYAQSNSIQATVRWLFNQTDGRIFAVFHNGAYGQPGAVEDLSRTALCEQFEANVFGWQELTNLLLPAMRKANSGRIIYNSSVLGVVAMRWRGAYNASKFALEGLADTLRLELRQTNIKVCLIEPGPIQSEFRTTAYAKFLEHINPKASAHQEEYQRVQARLAATDGDQKDWMTLPPEAVAQKVLRALRQRRPPARMPVTAPSHVLVRLKRLIPTKWLDALVGKVD